MGRIIFIVPCVLAALLTIPAASWTGAFTWISLAAASTAFVAMSLNQYLVTRPKFLESAFGGLDRMYGFHRQSGIFALGLLLLHYTATPVFDGKQLTSSLNAMAKNAGQVGFYGIVLLLIVSLIKRIPSVNVEIPYHVWRQSHRLIGIFYVFLVFHQFFIKRPFSGDALLANYLSAFAILGVGSFLYVQIIPFFRSKSYEIIDVDRSSPFTVITAKPRGLPIHARPGQFAFMTVKKFRPKEAHPFTIARYNHSGEVQLAIKPLGDFTIKIKDMIKVGDELYLEGGYGCFSYQRGGDCQIWLAGGIGITPFVAMAESLTPECDKKVHLIHSVRSVSEAYYSKELEKLQLENRNFTYELHDTGAHGRLDFQALIRNSPFEVNGSDFCFCGPPGLMSTMLDQARTSGVTFARVEFERFQFR